MTRPLTRSAALLRRLYPAEYRAAYGEEIVAVHAESVRHAGRRAAAHEWAVLAAHALRLRTRLSSRDPAGQVLAGAAPFLLAGGAALGVVHLLIALVLRATGSGHAPAGVGVAQAAPWVLALLCAALGRWTAARVLVLVAVVAAQCLSGLSFGLHLDLVELWALMGVLVLLAPPDAVDPSRRGRVRAAVAAAAVAVPMGGLAALWIVNWPDDYLSIAFTPLQESLLLASTAWPAVVMVLAYLRHLADPATDRLRAGGVALAVLPWVVAVVPPLYDTAFFLNLDAMAVLVLLVAATAVGFRRRNRLAGPAGPETPDPLR
ncbi:hypothetical protein ACIQF6_16390 [Kitasatospora sp. NPDC092948]|uniref:hypothetical protein n=1 Tax=Kitasatospora sp. NPDC092948 TaxID=3364088 RepID=UPI0037F89659